MLVEIIITFTVNSRKSTIERVRFVSLGIKFKCISLKQGLEQFSLKHALSGNLMLPFHTYDSRKSNFPLNCKS